jgi:hypothetical protein
MARIATSSSLGLVAEEMAHVIVLRSGERLPSKQVVLLVVV